MLRTEGSRSPEFANSGVGSISICNAENLTSNIPLPRRCFVFGFVFYWQGLHCISPLPGKTGVNPAKTSYSKNLYFNRFYRCF